MLNKIRPFKPEAHQSQHHSHEYIIVCCTYWSIFSKSFKS